MRSIDNIKDFIDPFVGWAKRQPDIQAVALVGSYARSAASETSDIDIMLLVDNPKIFITDSGWLNRFGNVEQQHIEDYGMVASLRVWYNNGYEVEFGVTTPDWGQSPDDLETQSVIRDGMIIPFERNNLLSSIL